MAAGGYVCLLNFKLLVAWASHRLGSHPDDTWTSVSPIPIFGSLIVALMLRTLGSNDLAWCLGIVFIAIDAGGIPWMLLAIVLATGRGV